MWRSGTSGLGAGSKAVPVENERLGMKIIHCQHCGTRMVWLEGVTPVRACVNCRDHLKDSALIKLSIHQLKWFVDSCNTDRMIKKTIKNILEVIEVGREKVYGKLEQDILISDCTLYLKGLINTDGYAHIEVPLYYNSALSDGGEE